MMMKLMTTALKTVRAILTRRRAIKATYKMFYVSTHPSIYAHRIM